MARINILKNISVKIWKLSHGNCTSLPTAPCLELGAGRDPIAMSQLPNIVKTFHLEQLAFNEHQTQVLPHKVERQKPAGCSGRSPGACGASLCRADNWLVDTASERPIHNGLSEFGKVSGSSLGSLGKEGGRTAVGGGHSKTATPSGETVGPISTSVAISGQQKPLPDKVLA